MSLLESSKSSYKSTISPTQKGKVFSLLKMLSDRSAVHSDKKISEIAVTIASLFEGIPENSFLLWAVSEEMERISYSKQDFQP